MTGQCCTDCCSPKRILRCPSSPLGCWPTISEKNANDQDDCPTKRKQKSQSQEAAFDPSSHVDGQQQRSWTIPNRFLSTTIYHFSNFNLKSNKSKQKTRRKEGKILKCAIVVQRFIPGNGIAGEKWVVETFWRNSIKVEILELDALLSLVTNRHRRGHVTVYLEGAMERVLCMDARLCDCVDELVNRQILRHIFQ